MLSFNVSFTAPLAEMSYTSNLAFFNIVPQLFEVVLKSNVK